jgi:hypothetical protein
MKLPSLDFLINPFKSDNNRLFQILSTINSSFQIVAKQFNSNEVQDNNFEIRFQLAGTRNTGTNTYPVYYQVTMPLYVNNSPIFTYAKITYWQINCKIVGGADYSISLWASKDRGVTFNNLMINPMKLPAGLTRVDGGTEVFANPNLGFDWFLRLDEIGDGVISGVELILQGAYA